LYLFLIGSGGILKYGEIKISELKSFVYLKALAIAYSSLKSTLIKGSDSGLVPSVVIITRKFQVFKGRGSNSAQFKATVHGESTNDSRSSSRVNDINKEGCDPKSQGLHIIWKWIGVNFLKYVIGM